MPESLLDTYLPDYRMRQLDRVRVKAPPPLAWPVVRALEIEAGFFSRVLFGLRALPELLRGRARRPPKNSAATWPMVWLFSLGAKGLLLLLFSAVVSVIVLIRARFQRAGVQ